MKTCLSRPARCEPTRHTDILGKIFQGGGVASAEASADSHKQGRSVYVLITKRPACGDPR